MFSEVWRSWRSSSILNHGGLYKANHLLMLEIHLNVCQITYWEGEKKRMCTAIRTLFCATCKPTEIEEWREKEDVPLQWCTTICGSYVHSFVQVRTVSQSNFQMSKSHISSHPLFVSTHRLSCQSIKRKSSTEHMPLHRPPLAHLIQLQLQFPPSWYCLESWQVSGSVRTQVLRAKVSSPLVCGR